MKNESPKSDKSLPIHLLEEFSGYYKKYDGSSVINIDDYLNTLFDFQVQRFEDAIKVFKGSIPPCRYSHYYVALTLSGSGYKSIGLTEFEVKKNTLMLLSSGVINSSRLFTKDITGYILSFSSDFLLNQANKKMLSGLACFKLNNIPYIYVDNKESNDLKILFESIIYEYLNSDKLKDKMIRFKIMELLVLIERIYDKYYGNNESTITHSFRITDQFKQLLENSFLREKQVSFYASEIGIHPNYLNQTIKEQTGKTCSELINERVLLEAKCLLMFDDLSVKLIADYLNFKDASYFSKYFKRLTRMTPQEYKTAKNL
jgi:AraC family transcriptional regulator, transcriptional activator of pobA